MRKVVVGLLGVALASGAGTLLPGAAIAAPAVGSPPVRAVSPVVPAGTPVVRAATPVVPAVSATDPTAGRGAGDDLPNPLEDKRRALRQEAVADVVSGRAKAEKRGVSTVLNLGRTFGTGTAGGKLPKKGRDQYVELAREKTDKIFVILAEFGNERHPDFPDKDVNPNTAGPVTFDGPLHNQIPKPDRSLDNTTNWQASYPADHFRKLYFGTGKQVESLRTYYETQSSGRYSVNGKVTDWVKVKYNEARYGRSGDNPNDANGDDPAVCDGNICDNSWALVRDAANQWVADQQQAGRSETQIATDLKSFDKQDRYDFDGDGNFNEPDGYFDHFQIVFAGTDEADYNQFQGEDGLWSHRWFAYYPDRGRTGPAGNKQGGTQLGNTGLWIGDYTMQPENGGLGTFAHEYAHDLGLPDDYDTSGRGGNNQSFWTLMANNRLSKPGDGGFDTRAGDLGAWNKLQLGWLDYETVVAGKTKTLDLGPQEYNTAKPQAVVVVLPKKKVNTAIGAPYAGTRQYHSGNANNLDTTMTRRVRPHRQDHRRAVAQGPVHHRVRIRLPLRRGVRGRRQNLEGAGRHSERRDDRQGRDRHPGDQRQHQRQLGRRRRTPGRVRGPQGPAAPALPDRRHGRAGRLLRRRDHGRRRRRPTAARRRGDRHHVDPEGLHGDGVGASSPNTTTTTSPVTARTCRTTSTSRPARTSTRSPTPGPAWWITSRSSRVCWSPTGTRRRRTTTPTSTTGRV